MVEEVKTEEIFVNSVHGTMSAAEMQELTKQMQDADEDLMHMDTQANEAFTLASLYHDFEQKKQASLIQAAMNEEMTLRKTKTMVMESKQEETEDMISSKQLLSQSVLNSTDTTDGPDFDQKPGQLKKGQSVKVKAYHELELERGKRTHMIENPLMEIMSLIETSLGEQGLPDSLPDALAMCQKVKELIYNRHVEEIVSQFGNMRVAQSAIGRMSLVSYITDEGRRSTTANNRSNVDSTITEEEEAEQSKFDAKMEEVRKFESMLNSCLIEEIASDERYAAIDKMEGICLNKSDELFNGQFDKTKIQQMLHEVEQQSAKAKDKTSSPEEQFSVEAFIINFVTHIDSIFVQKFIDEPLCDLFFQEIENVPEFLCSHFKHKIWQRMTDRINGFKSGFVSTIEENWLNFIKEERKNLQFWENKQAYKPKPLNLEVLTAAFSIIVILPLRAEVKHDHEIVSQKVQAAKKELKLPSKPYPTWDFSQPDIDRRVKVFKKMITKYGEDDYVLIVQTIHRLMFTLLNTFINTKQYDSKDRHLLKLFLEAITPILRELMLLNETVKLHFFLQIFESQFGTRVPKDKYDLQLMSKLFGEELLDTLKITQSMTRCKVLDLTRVTTEPNLQSKHVIICISGFLQQKEDNRITWGNVDSYYKNSEVYALQWTACNSTDFFNKGIFDSKKTTSFQKLLNTANLFSTANRQYIFAYDQARLSGSLLAIFLLKSNFSDGRAVNLIGFSLGTVVVMNCVRVLKYMYRRGFVKAGKILHDVHLWAGAYVIDPNKTLNERMRSAFHCSVVNGKLVNVYSYKDNAIKFGQPRMQPGTKAIGAGEILLDVPDDEDGSINCKKARNQDVTKIAGDHGGFTIYCEQFMPFTPQSY